jgi:glycosyltransferase involved in cell wall biosynthesis
MHAAPSIRAYNMYNALKEIADVTLISRPTYNFIPQGSKLSYLNFLLSLFGQMSSEIIQLIKKNEIDYVYIEALGSCLHNFDYIFLNALKKRDISIFPFIRDLYWKYPGTLKQTDKGSRNCQREYNWYLKNATALLFPSKIMADTVDFPEKYALPPAGDPSRCLSEDLPDTKNILYLGGIFLRSGMDILMEAMKKYVLKEHPDASCTVVGTGDIEMINRWRHEKWLHFGTGNYWDMPEIMSKAYLTTIPRYIGGFLDITIPLKLFDYMSAGRPIVATDCLVTAKFMRENEIGIITKDTPESLAEGIIKLFDDPDLAKKMGRNAISAVRSKHSWHHRAERLIQIMERY